MEINRLTFVLSVGQITGGGITVSGNADDVIRTPRERNYLGWTDTGMGDPIPPTRTSVIEPYMQGYQKGNRLIGSIGSIV